MGRRAIAAAVLLLGLAAGDAHATHWPVFGGDASRSSLSRAESPDAPIARVWAKGDGSVRTPVVISGGGGPDVQRVAYGTAAGRVHLQVLATGAPVGPEEGVAIDSEPQSVVTGNFFGGAEPVADGGGVGFADTSTEERLGQLLVVHNDESVQVARIDLATGERVVTAVSGGADFVVPGTFGCRAESSPVLTPPDDQGGRILFFTIGGTCDAGPGLVRIVIPGDATARSVEFLPAETAPVAQVNPPAPPALVVLDAPSGGRRFYVAVAAGSRILFFDADQPLGGAPALAANLEGIVSGIAAPASPSGLVAGSSGSGTGKAPALYAVSNVSLSTRVYKVTQAGAGAQLTTVLSQSLTGEAAPGLAAAETVGAAGPLDGGRLVVTTSSGLTALRTSDLGVTGAAGGSFSRTVAAVAGSLVFAQRDDGVHVVARLGDLSPVGLPPGDSSGLASWGQPAISRGYAVFGSGGGAFTYATRDATAPQVDLSVPAGVLGGAVGLAATAGDARGVRAVTFRLVGQGSSRVLATDSTAEGSPFSGGRYGMTFQTASVPDGDYAIEAAATDAAGNTGVARAAVTIVNGGAALPPGLKPGACANQLLGTAAADLLGGGASGDRLLGGDGDDRLRGEGGEDCLYGQKGADDLSGGAGGDVLHGGDQADTVTGGRGADRVVGGAGSDTVRSGTGSDTISSGSGSDDVSAGSGNDRIVGGAGNDELRGDGGNDRIVGGSGNDELIAGTGSNGIDGGAGNDRILARNGRRDAITCGAGRDRVSADRVDRVAGNCERVTRRGRRR